MKQLLYILISMALLAGCDYPIATPVDATGKVIFSELFSDNSKNWPIIHDDTTDIKILAEEYQFLLTGKSNKSGKIVWHATVNNTLNTDIDTDTLVSKLSTNTVANFRIEANFRYINGDITAPFGLAFGVTDVNNYLFFGIKKAGVNDTTSGGYIIGSSVDGVFTPIVDWTPTKLYAGYNTLKVEKNGSSGPIFTYYVNNIPVHTTHMPSPFAKNLGFYAAGDVSIAADDVKVTTGFATH